MAHNLSDSASKYIKILPVVAIVIMAVFIGFQFKDTTVEQIVNYTPENHFLAACGMIAFYALKSISIVFPMIVLQISTGMIFSPFWAIVVNLIGSFVASAVPYAIGRLTGRDFVVRILKKTKKFGEISNMPIIRNQWFFSYFLRVISILPGDLVSMFLGSIGLRFTPYITGSVLGILPGMIAATFMGSSITDPTSPEFILSLVATIVLSIISYLAYRRWK